MRVWSCKPLGLKLEITLSVAYNGSASSSDARLRKEHELDAEVITARYYRYCTSALGVFEITTQITAQGCWTCILALSLQQAMVLRS